MAYSKSTVSLEQQTRIDSWKEIAAFFGRDERTVKRWEKERALPIHRLPGERGGVFAYLDELTGWLNSTPPAASLAEQEPPAPSLTLVAEKQEEPHARTLISIDAAQASPAREHKAIFAIAAIATLALLSSLVIAEHLKSRHIEAAVAAARPHHVPDAEAEQFYLRGSYYCNRRTRESLTQAVDAFTQAVVHDSDYAQAYAGLAESYDLMPQYSPMSRSDAFPRAAAAASKAIALDDSLSEAHAALAFALFFGDQDVPRAFKEYQTALRLDPHNADAQHWYATSLMSSGKYQEALVEIDKAQQLDPTSRSILSDQALLHYHAGDPETAIAKLREIEQEEPDFLSAPRYLAGLALERKDYRSFIQESKRLAALSKDSQEAAVSEAAVHGWAEGGEHGMFEAMRKVQQEYYDRGQSSGFELARTDALMGRNREAVTYLKAAYGAHDYMILQLPHAGWSSGLQGDPDFVHLKKQIDAQIDQRA
jgi:tetratricopeptide (TPR) repeat protein